VNFYRYGIPNGEGLPEEERLNHLMLSLISCLMWCYQVKLMIK
jgi:hypothetical protein